VLEPRHGKEGHPWPHVRSPLRRRLLPLVGQGKGLAIDIAVTCPFTERHVRLEEPCEDYAALQKHAKYDADFKDTDYFFAALVFETTGAINAEGTRVLSQIFRFAASRLGHEFSSYCGRAW